MMTNREILFRGKTLVDNKWIYGDLIRENVFGEIHTRIYRITSTGWELVDACTDTVGQFTGFNDIYDRKIFEGDVVAFWDCSRTESGYYEQRCIGEVKWSTEQGCFFVTNTLSAESYEVFNECEIIGNVYDNPEMLEES